MVTPIFRKYCTGCNKMLIFYDDLEDMFNKAKRSCPFMGYVRCGTANGTVLRAICKIEVNIIWSSWSSAKSFARPWFPVQAVVVERRFTPGDPRLAHGALLRALFYTGTAPDNRGKLYVGETHAEF